MKIRFSKDSKYKDSFLHDLPMANDVIHRNDEIDILIATDFDWKLGKLKERMAKSPTMTTTDFADCHRNSGGCCQDTVK